MRKRILFATALMITGLSLSGCYGDGRPGHNSDRHHHHHGDHDGDHDHWR